MTAIGAGRARRAGQPSRLVINVSSPFRLDYVVWALRRRAHNEVDRFDAGCYRRVLSLAGEPAEVTVRQDLAASPPKLIAELHGPAGPAGRAAVTEARPVLARILGLHAGLAGFYRVAAGDARLNALALRFRGMRPPCFPTVFEAVVNAVACQQLSLDVGIHLLSRLARRFGPAVPGPVTRYGFPAPGRLAAADPAELRALGFSTAKARTITAIAGQAAAGALDLEALRDAGDDRAMSTLLGLPGIGRWSAEYVMLRGLARYHVLPGDDVGARNNLRRRFGIAEDAGYDAVATLSRRWQPYAGLVYFHLLLDALAARGDLGEAGPPLRYQPGQYVLLGDPGAELVVRSYSIANAPRRDGLVSLLVTRVPGGQVSSWVHDVLRPGDRVLLSGPYGSFTAAPGEPGPVLYLAGGSGLAPVRALAEAALWGRTRAPVVLFFSARTQQDLIDDERFRTWQRRHPGFRYLRTLTRADGPPPAGRIPVILAGWFPDLSGWRVYVAGAPRFVTACAAAAGACGARPGRVHAEEFFTEPQPWGAAQPATATESPS